MSISITVAGTAYDVPSSAADTNWAADQVVFEQALADTINSGATAAAGTAGSGTGITAASTTGSRNVIHKLTISYSAVQTAATTKDITIWTLPAKTRVLSVVGDVTTLFTGALSTVTLKSGNTAGGSQYFSATDVLSDTVVCGGTLSSNQFFGFNNTTPVQCRFTSTGGNLSTLTQGVVTFYIECVTYP